MYPLFLSPIRPSPKPNPASFEWVQGIEFLIASFYANRTEIFVYIWRSSFIKIGEDYDGPFKSFRTMIGEHLHCIFIGAGRLARFLKPSQICDKSSG